MASRVCVVMVVCRPKVGKYERYSVIDMINYLFPAVLSYITLNLLCSPFVICEYIADIMELLFALTVSMKEANLCNTG